MPGFFHISIGSALGVALLAIILAGVLARRLWRSTAALADARRQAEARARCLGLVAQELQASGFALLGLPGPPAAAARRLLDLADDVGEALAAEAAPRHLVPGRVPLAPLLEETVATVAAQLGASQRHWRLSPEFEAMVLDADRRALHGALLQVLGRAARMTRPGDWIRLRPVVTEDSLAIVIEDEGVGAPAEDLNGMEPQWGSLEEPRWEAVGEARGEPRGEPLGEPRGEPRGTRGLGFGLTLARSLLEAHGGALRLEAMPGIGARAWLTLPLERLRAAPQG